MLRKLLKVFIGLFLIFAIAVGLISIKHPIILKWVIGSARLIGKPISATIYTNGQINHGIKIFHVDKYQDGKRADYYILYTTYAGNNSKLNFFCVNKEYNYAGRPAATNIRDYDFISGYLFQSESGGLFTPFQDDMKGFDFNPQLTFSGRQIKLKIPPAARELKCDSIRIEL